ncbi:tRNA lysidine(34) synthetase TilS [Phycisphaerales bacterium AB-hyl4]|uniref:tRNA(Ile)-lysidine synthase n=1 Tax=Natronomicrosphaera hydrolytica TaxID=3242702 RepID=A0ABV4U136_9BACT
MPADPPNLIGHPLVQAVARALRRRCRVRPPARVLVAVSGGADSVALLRALALLSERRGFGLQLGVGHVQHHLRDPASEEDAVFVESLAGTLDLPYFRADLQLSSANFGANQPAIPTNLEARARRERYTALLTMAEAFETDLIATAHHSDDQLETLLMRLLRGAGVVGLRGIAWRRNVRFELRGSTHDLAESPASSPTRSCALIRPMLAATRENTLDFLKQLGQPWREDHTNADTSRWRARLRQDVLPVLREMRGNASTMAVSLADHARDVHRLIEAEVSRHHERVDRNSISATLDRGEARLMPRVVLVALLRRLLNELGVPRDRLGKRTLSPIVRAIRDRTGGTRHFDLTQAMHVTITRSEITLGPV